MKRTKIFFFCKKVKRVTRRTFKTFPEKSNLYFYCKRIKRRTFERPAFKIFFKKYRFFNDVEDVVRILNYGKIFWPWLRCFLWIWFCLIFWILTYGAWNFLVLTSSGSSYIYGGLQFWFIYGAVVAFFIGVIEPWLGNDNDEIKDHQIICYIYKKIFNFFKFF